MGIGILNLSPLAPFVAALIQDFLVIFTMSSIHRALGLPLALLCYNILQANLVHFVLVMRNLNLKSSNVFVEYNRIVYYCAREVLY